MLGLVSTFLLIFGLSGGGQSSQVILLAGITAAVAGAISMAIGEYIATKSQAEVLEGDIALEKEHFVHYRDIELDELRDHMASLGLSGNLLERCVQKIGEKDETLLKFMLSMEFGFTEEDERSPLMAMLFSGCLFIVGAVPSVLPFCCTENVTAATIAAGVLCAVACFIAGSVKTLSTAGNPVYDGLENVLIGCAGAGVSFGIGALYESTTN